MEELKTKAVCSQNVHDWFVDGTEQWQVTFHTQQNKADCFLFFTCVPSGNLVKSWLIKKKKNDMNWPADQAKPPLWFCIMVHTRSLYGFKDFCSYL